MNTTDLLSVDELHKELYDERKDLNMIHCLSIALVLSNLMATPPLTELAVAVLNQAIREAKGGGMVSFHNFLLASNKTASAQSRLDVKRKLEEFRKSNTEPRSIALQLFPLTSRDEVRRAFDFAYVYTRASKDDYHVIYDELVHN